MKANFDKEIRDVKAKKVFRKTKVNVFRCKMPKASRGVDYPPELIQNIISNGGIAPWGEKIF